VRKPAAVKLTFKKTIVGNLFSGRSNSVKQYNDVTSISFPIPSQEYRPKVVMIGIVNARTRARILRMVGEQLSASDLVLSENERSSRTCKELFSHSPVGSNFTPSPNSE
jgi:hypothetical protein